MRSTEESLGIIFPKSWGVGGGWETALYVNCLQIKCMLSGQRQSTEGPKSSEFLAVEARHSWFSNYSHVQA